MSQMAVGGQGGGEGPKLEVDCRATLALVGGLIGLGGEVVGSGGKGVPPDQLGAGQGGQALALAALFRGFCQMMGPRSL